MKAALRRAARDALAAWPARAALRAFALRGGPVTVLCYHTLGPDEGGPDAWTVLRTGDFRAHLAILREAYDIVDLDTALAAGPGQAGRPRAVLTFDDGETGLHRHLLPLLETERVPATVYIATRQIETGQPYWFDRLMGALQGPRTVDLRQERLGVWTLPAAPGASRWLVLSDLLEALKRADPKRREELTDRILADHPQPPGRPPLGPMTRAELAELAACPWVTIGAHSHCHSLLDQIPPAEARESMAQSRALLEGWTGREVAHFAWPNGNHTAELRRIAAELGFRSATALGGLWRRGADPFALPRLAIGRYDNAARFRLRLSEV